MDVILVIIAGLSLLLTVAMGLVLFKLLGEERQRSDARVALLTAAAAPPESMRFVATSYEIGADADTRTDEAEGASHDLFAAAPAASPWGRRMAVATALAALTGLLAYAVVAGTRSTPQAAVAAAAAAPLELLTLQHSQTASALVISGIVLNPRSGMERTAISATALLFGAAGEQTASGRAPLDYVRIAPGDRSPFVLTVPVTGPVSRYRLAFRDAEDAVVAHVDRRAAGTSAQHKNQALGRTGGGS